MFGNMCRYVFDDKLSQGRQCNPNNFLYHRKTKMISMGPSDVIDCYKAEGSTEEANDIFALGLTLQFILTGVESVPAHHSNKARCELSDEAWGLIDALVRHKTCTTWIGLQETVWWLNPPSALKLKQKRQFEDVANAAMIKIHEDKSKYAPSLMFRHDLICFYF